MEKSCQSSGDSTMTTTSSNVTTNNNNNNYLKQLNKLSHKISKPTTTTNTSTTTHYYHSQPQQQQQRQELLQQNLINNNNNTDTSNNNSSSSSSSISNSNLQQNQPPVYNINKNDFRDVVQKLTGSPAHERIPNLNPNLNPPLKPQSSRLHRIRPPPLVHISNRPPHLLTCAAPVASFLINRPLPPLSPLPPLPAVHAAAESPVSAYMRHLLTTNSSSNSTAPFSGFLPPLAPLVSPRWNNLSPAPSQPHQQEGAASTTVLPPPSPPPFGCLTSPSLLLSPSSFPLSPTTAVPAASPRWREL